MRLLLALVERAQVALARGDRAGAQDALATLGDRLQREPDDLERATLIERVGAAFLHPSATELGRLRRLLDARMNCVR